MTAPLPLPVEVPVRRVVGTDINDNGIGIIGTLTFTAQPAELIARTAKTSIFTQPKTVPVTAGAFTADLIAYDGPTVDAGLAGAPWAYQVIRSWQPRNPFYIVVSKGPLGTTADPSLDISSLIVPSPPAGVAIVKGDKGDSGPASVAYDTNGVPYLLPAPAGASNRLVTEASTVFDGRYKDTTKATGVSNPAVVRTIADPNRTASKWRELVNTGMFQTTKPDPVYFLGWNADKVAGGGDVAETAIYMGFEADYWDTPTNRTSEWYIGVVRADGSGPQFRPFAFTAARDSNLDLSASVQVDIGNNANGSTRSAFNVVGNGIAFVTVQPTGANFAVPVSFNANIQVVSGGLNLSTTASGSGHLSFLQRDVLKWYLANFDGDTSHYLWDAVGNRFMTHYTTGATSDAAQVEFNATLKLNGTQPTTAAAGTAAALPATPQGYFQVKDSAGVSRKVPYYV